MLQYMSLHKPIKDGKMNKLVFINETIVSLSTMWLPFLTEMVGDPYNQYLTGFGPVILMATILVFNIAPILDNLFKATVLWCIQKKNRFEYWQVRKEY